MARAHHGLLGALLTALTLCFLGAAAAYGQRNERAEATPQSKAFLNTLSPQERDWLRAHPVIRVGHDPGWPPIEFSDEQGEVAGMSADYLNLVEARLGIKFERIRGLTWQQTYARMKRWEIDLAPGVASTPQRTEFWAFTEPYMTIPIVIATQLDVTYVGDMAELVGKKVAVVDGYAIADWLPRDLPGIPLLRVESADAGIKMVQRGEAFAYLDNLLIVGTYQARANISNIKIAGQTPYVNAQRMAVRKDWAPLAQILDKALKSIPETDRREIYRKWLPLRYESRFDYVLFWRVLGVVGAILVALLWRNRKLALEISSRKKAEGELRQSEVKFRTMVETFPLAIHLSTGPEQKMEYVNPTFTKLFGYTLRDISSLEQWGLLAYPEPNYRRWVYDEKAKRTSAGLATSDPLERMERMEVVVTCKDGSKRDISWDYIRLGDAEYSCGLDLTERNQAEALVATQKERLSVTLRSIGDGVITTDLQGQVLFLNRVAEGLCGCTPEQGEGKPIASVFRTVHVATHLPVVNTVDKVLECGEAVAPLEERWLIAADGTERLVTETGAPIRDTNGKVVGVVLVFKDVTERQKLLESAERTERLEALGVLAGGIAHDFNNLLAALFGCIELAKITLDAQSTAAQYLESALGTLTRATGLTQQLLTFARGGAPVRKTGSLSALLKKSAQFALSGSNVSCSFEISEALWLCDYDEGQVARAIDNIVLNAVQAMTLGGTLRVSAENVVLKEGDVPSLRLGKYVHLAFADTGGGIPPNIRTRIFDPFFTTKEQGTGLGLAAVYSIVKKHDGEITVDSEPGAGTTFHIYLPVSHQTAALDTPYDSAPHQGTGRVLIMDDDASVRRTVGTMIELMGYEVAYAENGEQAIQAVRDASDTPRPFRAAIMDLTIPGGLGGKDAVAQLRETQSDLVVFAASGYSEDPIMADPAQFGFSDSIRKPFTRAQLQSLFARHLADGAVGAVGTVRET